MSDLSTLGDPERDADVDLLCDLFELDPFMRRVMKSGIGGGRIEASLTRIATYRAAVTVIAKAEGRAS